VGKVNGCRDISVEATAAAVVAGVDPRPYADTICFVAHVNASPWHEVMRAT